MKAIVVRQPWATLIALGVKTIETRPSPPNGPMRPDGVRGLPGCTLVRGERVAIVAGRAMGVPSMTKLGDCAQVFRRLDGGWDLGHGPIFDGSEFRGFSPLPLGAVVCTVTVDDALPVVAPMTDPPFDHLTPTTDGHLVWWAFTPVLGQRRWSARSRHPMLNERTVVDGLRDPDLDPQLPLGDFTPGRWGWLLGGVKLCAPVPCKGRQGVFVLPDDVAEKVG